MLTSIDSFFSESRNYVEQINKTEVYLSWATPNSSSDLIQQMNSSMIQLADRIRIARDEITNVNVKVEQVIDAVEKQRVNVSSETARYQAVVATHNILWRNISDLINGLSTLKDDYQIVLDSVNKTKVKTFA